MKNCSHMSRGGLLALAALAGSSAALPAAAQVRSYDGLGNNLANPEWGATHIQLIRMCPPAYADGLSVPMGMGDLPSARAVSNAMSDHPRETPIRSARSLTSLVIFWGQFIDHDIGLTEPPSSGAESFPIPVPAGDPWFDPDNTGTAQLGFSRSVFDPATGSVNARQQLNEITAYIDASMVYGSDETRANALRAFAGGRLATSAGDLMPYNVMGLPNANPTPMPDAALFIGGDVRANEQPVLASLHTLFVREHNRLADEIAAENPGWTDEQIYQEARTLVGAIIQRITYHEWLPALVGEGTVTPYSGYDDTVNASIANEFAHAAFRFGHSMVNPFQPVLEDDGTTLPGGPLNLFEGFFNPTLIENIGIEPILRGAAAELSQEIDPLVIDDLRNLLFGNVTNGMDLASLNIQRGRDHGIPTLNEARAALGLPPHASFADFARDDATAANLASVYDDVEDVDLWVGGLSESHVDGSLGETFGHIIVDQFERLRDGDRFYYESTLSGDALALVEASTLGAVIKRNTGITYVQDDVFFAPLDYDRNTIVNIFDVLAFLAEFQAGDLRADFDRNGVVEIFDVIAYIGAFQSNL